MTSVSASGRRCQKTVLGTSQGRSDRRQPRSVEPVLATLALAGSLILCGCASPPASPNETSAGWLKYPQNPIIGGWWTGTIFDVSVILDSKKYRMWGSWRRKASIALFESTDGEQWTSPSIVLRPQNSAWEQDVNRPSVVRVGSTYHMWYTGQANGHSAIGYAVSSNGRDWTRVGNQPVLTPTAPWEKEAVMCPSVLWDEGTKTFRMWYSGGEQFEPDAIGYATSPDGTHWTKDAANPIFRPEPKHAWESAKVAGAEVIDHDGWFYMFYIGYRDIHHANINMARSRDGISNWERHPQNPIISPSENGWDRDSDYKPLALPDPSGSRWLLWYNGRRRSSERIGLAIHQGGTLNWE